MITVEQRRALWRLPISSNAKVLAALLVDLQSLGRGRCDMSLGRLAAETGTSRSAVIRTVAELRDLGALAETKQRGCPTWRQLDLITLIGTRPDIGSRRDPHSGHPPDPISVHGVTHIRVTQPDPHSGQDPTRNRSATRPEIGPRPDPKSGHKKREQRREQRREEKLARARDPVPAHPSSNLFDLNRLVGDEATAQVASGMRRAWNDAWCRLTGDACAPADMLHEVGKHARLFVVEAEAKGVDAVELARESIQGFLGAKRESRRPALRWWTEDPLRWTGRNRSAPTRRDEARRMADEELDARLASAEAEAAPPPSGLVESLRAGGGS